MKRTLEGIGLPLIAFIIVLGLLIIIIFRAPGWAINFTQGTSFFTILKDLADLSLLMVELSAIIIVSFIIIYVIPSRSRRHKFVFGGISDTPQLATTLQRPIDFNKLAMEELVKQTRIVYSQIEEYAHFDKSSNNKRNAQHSGNDLHWERDREIVDQLDRIRRSEGRWHREPIAHFPTRELLSNNHFDNSDFSKRGTEPNL